MWSYPQSQLHPVHCPWVALSTVPTQQRWLAWHHVSMESLPSPLLTFPFVELLCIASKDSSLVLQFTNAFSWIINCLHTSFKMLGLSLQSTVSGPHSSSLHEVWEQSSSRPPNSLISTFWSYYALCSQPRFPVQSLLMVVPGACPYTERKSSGGLAVSRLGRPSSTRGLHPIIGKAQLTQDS